MPLPPTQNLSVVAGDDWSYPAVFTLVSGSLTGSTIWLTLKASKAQADAAAALQISTDTGGVVIDDGTHATFTLTAEQTEALNDGEGTARYFYDVAVLTPGGKNYTALQGSFHVLPQITRTRA